MKEVSQEHTGLLRMGLEVDSSVTFWNQASPGESPSARHARAISEGWFSRPSEARLKYLLTELGKRFPDDVLPALKSWKPEQESQSALVCHWHLQWSDPLYRAFCTDFWVSRWASPESTIDNHAVQGWLEKRGNHADWSPSTTRRLASGLLSAATDAGLCKGAGKNLRELRVLQASPSSLDYLKAFLSQQSQDQRPVSEDPYLCGISITERSGFQEGLTQKGEGGQENALGTFAASFAR